MQVAEQEYMDLAINPRWICCFVSMNFLCYIIYELSFSFACRKISWCELLTSLSADQVLRVGTQAILGVHEAIGPNLH